MANAKGKLKWRCAVYCIVLSATLGHPACKDSDGIPHGPWEPPPPKKAVISLENVTGAARYSDQNDIYVKFDFSAQILSHDDIGGDIFAWRIYINKDDKFLLGIAENNYNDDYFNLSIHSTSGSYAIPGYSTVVLTIRHDENSFTPGYPFGRDVPNNMDFYVYIEDNNGWEHTLKVNVPFSYTPL